VQGSSAGSRSEDAREEMKCVKKRQLWQRSTPIGRHFSTAESICNKQEPGSSGTSTHAALDGRDLSQTNQACQRDRDHT
jgi:hypothetical protein